MKQSSLSFVFINGRGSSGKDTQADLLVAHNSHAIRISTGDIYRGAKTPDGPFGKFHEQIRPHIDHVDKGGYIPNEVIFPIVDQVIEGYIRNGKDTFVFTGFPRTVEQLEAVDKYTKSLEGIYEKVNVNHLCYSVNPERSIKRAQQRRENAEKTGTSIRADDDPAIVAKRLYTYAKLTDPMIRLLAEQKRLCIIKSSGTIEDVRKRTEIALENAKKYALERSKRLNQEANGNSHEERR